MQLTVVNLPFKQIIFAERRGAGRKFRRGQDAGPKVRFPGVSLQIFLYQ
jgi:hypothetical protein